MEIFEDILIYIILLILTFTFMAYFSEHDSRLVKLESYHNNVCSKCGQEKN